jgi:hypothetical protein
MINFVKCGESWSLWFCEIFRSDIWSIDSYCKKRNCADCLLLRINGREDDVSFKKELIALKEGSFIPLIDEQL